MGYKNLNERDNEPKICERTRGLAFRATLTWAVKYLLHILVHFSAFVLAYELRRALPLEWWLTEPDALRVLTWAGMFALMGAVVEAVFQTERGAWRFASLGAVVALVRNVTISTALFVVVIFFADRGSDLPRSVLPLTWMLTLMLLVSVRMMFRLPRDRSIVAHLLPSWWRKRPSGKSPLLLFGDLDAADRQIRHILGDPAATYQPIGVVTPGQQQAGTRLHGVPWLGTLSNWTRVRGGVPAPAAILFLSDPIREMGLSVGQIGEIRSGGYRLLRLQYLADLADDGVASKLALREIPFEDFLPRQPLVLEIAPVRALIAGKRVLVTGGGGSIGSEIARQLVRLGCSRLTILDHSEFQLFQIQQELERSEGVEIQALIADVRDADRIRQIMADAKPDLVFHAAALKHVSLVEDNPVEGVRTNVLGTWNVLSASAEVGAAQFVLISTDKAAAPSNVMGATKRVAESLFGLAPEGVTRFSAVRFGNVLGSAGSVVPIFQAQIARGGPVTVTHPDVERFFMTIPEAVQLVLHSTALNAARKGRAEAKFVLEMGEPVKIVELARQMIQLSGKAPDVDIQIEFTGLKAGEKLSEILSDDGEEVFPCADGIMEVRPAGPSAALTRATLQSIVTAANRGEAQEVIDVLDRAIGEIRLPKVANAELA